MSALVLPPRPHPAFDLDERSMLTEFLDYQRATVHLKVTGLFEEDARRRFVPSLTSAAGIVKHLGYVEQSWFRARLAGERDLHVPWTDENPAPTSNEPRATRSTGCLRPTPRSANVPARLPPGCNSTVSPWLQA